ncbi:TRAM domain protein [uncultured archaeon]|nr:TRAM domain protein [uncultured archaeon]
MSSRPPVDAGEVVKVKVDTPGPAGAGLAHWEDYVIYVRGGEPGKTYQVKIRHVGRTFAEGDIVG